MSLKSITLSGLALLSLILPVASAAGMDGKTDYSSLYLIFGLSIIFLLVSVYTLYTVGANIISIATMALAGIGFMDIAKIFTDGSLAVMLQDGTVSNPIRNTSTGFLFQLVGLIFIGLTVVQALFLRNSKMFSKREIGEWDNERED